MDRRMGPHGILHFAAAGGGALVAAAAIFTAGAPALIVGAAALLGGVSGAALSTALSAGGARKAVEARFDTLAAEMVLLRQRQAEFETKLADVAQSSVESPALVWRAATADIQVLGALVSDLARTVAEHDDRLAEAPAAAAGKPAAEAERGFVLPRTSPPPPSWFEDEAELGFTADASPAPASPAAAEPRPLAPAVVAELKSTLAAALMSDRLELCLQPFVTLPQRKVAGYEATLALKAEGGELQGAEELRAAAEAAGMGRDLDRILVERVGQVLRVLRARERSVAMTCRVSGESLPDAGFRSAVEAVARGEGKLAQNIILSVPAADAMRLRAEGAEALESLRRAGVTLGVRALRTAGVDAAALEKLGVVECRLPAEALTAPVAGAEAGDIHPADMSELLQRRNIRLLVTGVDAEATVRDLLDLDAAMAQGELFGAARPVRPEVLQPRAVSEPAAKRAAAARQPETAVREIKRQSFRSLLRRA
jgi:cyclic-di-GMP phosphodiesterase TipF (flagellum assembly factor)